MKMSEMIKMMQDHIANVGDCEVMVFDPEKLHDGELIESTAFVVIGEDDDGAPTFVVCDQETRLSFDDAE